MDSGTNGPYHIYINNGQVSSDYPGTSFYRSQAKAGWSSVSLTNMTISSS